MIILNRENETHLDKLKGLFKDVDEAIITSPFLMEDLTLFFDEAFGEKLNNLTLYTTLPNPINELIRKSNSLVSAFDYAYQKENFHIDIRIVNNLHGKAYLALEDNKPVKALVSSANLTHRGLNKNHEWGVSIESSKDLKYLTTNIRELPFKKIDENRIIKLLDKIEQEEIPNKDIDIHNIDISDIIDPNIFEEVENEIWLKPIGHTESPIEPGRKFDKDQPRLHFSKRRPTGVKIDDLLITYGVGARAILSVYKVTSEPEHITDKEIKEGANERWPWYVKGKNLTPEFGAKWWEFDLKLNDLSEEYLSAQPEKPITDAGTQSFGAFNYGHDKLHLDKDFGTWLYNKVLNMI